MTKNDSEITVHTGPCDCVLVAYHILDPFQELQGLSYDAQTAESLSKRIEAKLGVPLHIERRDIFTLVRHDAAPVKLPEKPTPVEATPKAKRKSKAQAATT